MVAKKQQVIPDSTGTVALEGHEQLVDMYELKALSLQVSASEVDELKEELRSLTLDAQRKVEDRSSLKRIFVKGKMFDGVRVTIPDYAQDGNRLPFGDDKIQEITKAGGVEKTGLQPQDVFDEVTEPGGEVLTLRGPWIEWFMGHYKSQVESDPNISYEKREPSTKRKLKADAIAKLQAAADAGNPVARQLLELGLKAMTVESPKMKK
jgi:hypothetical protein